MCAHGNHPGRLVDQNLVTIPVDPGAVAEGMEVITANQFAQPGEMAVPLVPGRLLDGSRSIGRTTEKR